MDGKLYQMKEEDFICNGDFKDIIDAALKGSMLYSDAVSKAQSYFIGKRFVCSDLERCAKNEEHYISIFLDEYPPLADNEIMLSRWFYTLGHLSEEARYILKELRFRKRSFNENKFRHFKSIGLDYNRTIEELLSMNLIQEPTKEKNSPTLTDFAKEGMLFKAWQDCLIDIYIDTRIGFIRMQDQLNGWLDMLEKKKIIGIEIYAAGHELCEICFDYFKGKLYTKKEINDIPRLPLHWRCKCYYSPKV